MIKPVPAPCCCCGNAKPKKSFTVVWLLVLMETTLAPTSLAIWATSWLSLLTYCCLWAVVELARFGLLSEEPTRPPPNPTSPQINTKSALFRRVVLYLDFTAERFGFTFDKLGLLNWTIAIFTPF